MGGSEQEEPTALDRLDIGESNPPKIVFVFKVCTVHVYIYIYIYIYIPYGAFGSFIKIVFIKTPIKDISVTDIKMHVLGTSKYHMSCPCLTRAYSEIRCRRRGS